ncbi:MAG TPA: hypothetical protein PK765_05295 [bacterium]|nr:hypothetical protein [bacterium]
MSNALIGAVRRTLAKTLVLTMVMTQSLAGVFVAVPFVAAMPGDYPSPNGSIVLHASSLQSRTGSVLPSNQFILDVFLSGATFTDMSYSIDYFNGITSQSGVVTLDSSTTDSPLASENSALFTGAISQQVGGGFVTGGIISLGELPDGNYSILVE